MKFNEPVPSASARPACHLLPESVRLRRRHARRRPARSHSIAYGPDARTAALANGGARAGVRLPSQIGPLCLPGLPRPRPPESGQRRRSRWQCRPAQV
jgi:hypothetical protein